MENLRQCWPEVPEPAWAILGSRRRSPAFAACRGARPICSECLAREPVGDQPPARAALYVGSAVKTFINLRFLQDVEAGRLSENTQEVVDDGVRSLASPVFGHLTGTTTARSVLEA